MKTVGLVFLSPGLRFKPRINTTVELSLMAMLHHRWFLACTDVFGVQDVLYFQVAFKLVASKAAGRADV